MVILTVSVRAEVFALQHRQHLDPKSDRMHLDRPCAQGSQGSMGDDDDYFHNEAELPCIVPEELVVREESMNASISSSDERHSPAPQSQSSTSSRLAAAAASITRSEHLASSALPPCDHERRQRNVCVRCRLTS